MSNIEFGLAMGIIASSLLSLYMDTLNHKRLNLHAQMIELMRQTKLEKRGVK